MYPDRWSRAMSIYLFDNEYLIWYTWKLFLDFFTYIISGILLQLICWWMKLVRCMIKPFQDWTSLFLWMPLGLLIHHSNSSCKHIFKTAYRNSNTTTTRTNKTFIGSLSQSNKIKILHHRIKKIYIYLFCSLCSRLKCV